MNRRSVLHGPIRMPGELALPRQPAGIVVGELIAGARRKRGTVPTTCHSCGTAIAIPGTPEIAARLEQGGAASCAACYRVAP